MKPGRYVIITGLAVVILLILIFVFPPRSVVGPTVMTALPSGPRPFEATPPPPPQVELGEPPRLMPQTNR